MPYRVTMRGGVSIQVSMKFNRTPRLHVRLLFLQLLQCGSPSSHFRCRSRQVRHPVRTLLGFPPAPSLSFSASPKLIKSALLSARGPTRLTFFGGFLPARLDDSLRFCPASTSWSPPAVGSEDVGDMVLLWYAAYEGSRPGCR